MKLVKNETQKKIDAISDKEAEEAFIKILQWIGEDPSREGLLETPKRVIKAYEEFFAGYDMDPDEILNKTFEEVAGYDEMIIIKDIRLESHCEHHMVPILGVAHVAYLPKNKVVGISKLARVIDIFAKRLQTQETMTMQIIETIDEALDPLGAAIMIDAKHQCMTTRGISKPNVSTVTTKFSGLFAEDSELRERFTRLTQAKG